MDAATRDNTAEQVRLLNDLATEEHEYIQTHQDTVMLKQPDWNSLLRLGEMSGSEADAFTAMHLKSLDEIEEIILKTPSLLIAALKIMQVRTDFHPIQYILNILYELVRDNSGRYEYFCTILKDTAIFTPFNQLLENYAIDTYSQDRAAFLLTGFMCRARAGKFSMEEVKYTAHCLIYGRPNKRSQLSEVGKLDALINLLKSSIYRSMIWEMNGLVTTLQKYLQLTSPVSLQYRAVFCIWLLSFEEEFLTDMHSLRIDTAICELLRDSRKEKVVRVILKCFKNFLKNDETVEVLINSNSYHVLTVLAYEKWRDGELYEDMRDTAYLLDHKIKTFSNFDRYCLELDRGILRWSILHSETFWKENVMSFEHDEFIAIRKLLALLNSEDTVTLCVACFDIGEFARFHPAGKKMCHMLKIKDAVMLFINSPNRTVMLFINSPNRDVAREALLCLQKIMLNNWKDISSSDSKF